MDNWDATIIYHLAAARHREDIARGEAARVLTTSGTRPPRARLAKLLFALAQRLSPAPHPAPPESAVAAPGTLA